MSEYTIIKYENEDITHLQHQYPTPTLAGILAVSNQKARLEWIVNNTTGDNILEVGTCSGYVIHSVPGKYKVGLDNSEVRLKLASYEFGEETLWVLGNAIALPFADKEFDTVILADTLEHLDLLDAYKAVTEAARVGKKILITLPRDSSSIANNHEHLWSCTEEAVNNILHPLEYSLAISACSNFWLIVVSP